MSLFVLDTDHLTLIRYGNAEVTARLRATPEGERATTIISVEEQLRGWFTQVRKARDAAQLARAYRGLSQVVDMAKSVRVLPFTPSAIEIFLELRKALRRVGRFDLAIAAIVLEFDGTVVTRNRQDFEQVPGLRIEDWSKPRAED
jgi:tRNA(fMet)-specific endonuclease VapC